MPSFAEYIAESIESEVGLLWNLKSTSHAAATLIVEGVLVEASFEQREPDGSWYIAFDTVKGDLSDRNMVMLAFRIFNGVFQAVRDVYRNAGAGNHDLRQQKRRPHRNL